MTAAFIVAHDAWRAVVLGNLPLLVTGPFLCAYVVMDGGYRVGAGSVIQP